MPRPAKHQYFPYFPLVWGFDTTAERTEKNQIFVTAKRPVLGKDFRRGRDLYSCYLSSVKTEFGQKGLGRPSPHIAFANATTDQELLDFVREYGPIAPIDIKKIEPEEPVGASLDWLAQSRDELQATEDLPCLHRERQIYAAALSLMGELQKGRRKSHVATIRKHISEIVTGVTAWPDQWERENKWRALHNPVPIAWQFDSNQCDRLWSRKFEADWEPTEDGELGLLRHLGRPKPFDVGARVLCELINAFPVEIQVFNDHAIESLPFGAASFGVRPCLYLILRREFLSGRGTTLCRNDRCNRFFVSGRSGQVFCSADCSMQYRQRKYWAKTGWYKRKRRRAKVRRAAMRKSSEKKER